MYDADDFSISNLFWGSVIFLAIFVACLFAAKAIGWLRDRREPNGKAPDEGALGESPAVAISRPPGDRNYAAIWSARRVRWPRGHD